ncbi:MAG TPA: hypothetical protein VMC85_15305, partial [Desulfomonilaceae bacterium]|nr:hypothetical protein [Desulfomonilaceae bacterium]
MNVRWAVRIADRGLYLRTSEVATGAEREQALARTRQWPNTNPNRFHASLCAVYRNLSSSDQLLRCLQGLGVVRLVRQLRDDLYVP